MEIGPQAASDSAFTRKYRFHQSTYRATVLQVPFGYGPNVNSEKEYGSMLINGEKSGDNFISEAAFMFAKQKVLDKQINKDMTIEEFRLFNNMLSSMPMCFNLFGDLRKLLLENQNAVSEIVSEMFKEIKWIKNVTFIDVEFIPIPIIDYTNDKTAFDAMILVEDHDGKKGIISIETKYTDLLGSNSSSNKELKNQLISDNNIFESELVDLLKKDGYKQIHRNYLLTYAYAKKHKFKHFANVVISPKEDLLSQKEIDLLQTKLLQKKDTIFKIPLESVVERGINLNNNLIYKTLKDFKSRYIISEE